MSTADAAARGSSPAKRLRLQAHMREFQVPSGGPGGVGGLFGELHQRSSTAAAQAVKLGERSESGREQRRLLTEMVMPLAHAVASRHCVGRMPVPLKLPQFDERQGKADGLDIDINDPVPVRRLRSADPRITSK